MEVRRLGGPSMLLFLATVVFGSGLSWGQALDPERLSWTEIDYEAKKLFLTGRASVSVEVAPARRKRGARRTAFVGLSTRFLGRSWDAHLEGDAYSGVTSSFERFEVRSKDRASSKRVLYRPCATKISRLQRVPSEADQSKKGRSVDASFWTDGRTYEEPFPQQSCKGESHPWLMDPANLLYAVAASGFSSAAGQERRWKVLVDDVPVTVVAKTVGVEQVRVGYVLHKDGAPQAVQGPKDLLRIQVRGEALEGAESASGESVEIELLGLKGEALEIFLDLETNAPLEIRGPLSGLGTVRVRAKKVVL